MKKINTLILIILLTVFSVDAQNFGKKTNISSSISITSGIIIYPNPVTNRTFHIKSSQIIKTVEIFNALGEKIKTINNETNIVFNIYVELADTQKGMYMVKIVYGNKNVTIKKIYIK